MENFVCLRSARRSACALSASEFGITSSDHCNGFSASFKWNCGVLIHQLLLKSYFLRTMR